MTETGIGSTTSVQRLPRAIVALWAGAAVATAAGCAAPPVPSARAPGARGPATDGRGGGAPTASAIADAPTPAPPATSESAATPMSTVTTPGPAAAPHVVFDQTSAFGRVLVLDDGPRRVMRFGSVDGSDQSEIVRDDPRALPVEYMRYALLGLAYHGHPARVLMVGLGGGTFTTFLHHALPELTIDVVEIDPVVVAAARAAFDLVEDDRYRVHVADAAAWIARDKGRYDFVLLDAYAGESIPPAVGDTAFFRAVARHMAPGGVVAINIAEMQAEGAAVADNLRAVVAAFDCRRAPHDGNIVVFASAKQRPPAAADADALARWTREWDARGLTSFSLGALADADRDGADCARALGRKARPAPRAR